MTLTLARCENHVQHTLRTGAVSSELSVLELVNLAGQRLVGMHPWRWLDRSGSLTTVTAQEYVDLSTLIGFQSIYGAVYTDGASTWIKPIDMMGLLELRTTTSGTRTSHYSIVNTITTAGVLTPTMQITPTPSLGVANAIKCYYRAGWQVPLTTAEDQAKIAVPVFMEGMFLQVLRAHARGYEEEDEGTLQARMNEIKTSADFLDAVRVDSMLQSNFGTQRGGGVAMQENVGMQTRRYTPTVPSP